MTVVPLCDGGGVALPRRAYLICANQRSGSTLLCRALANTGIAGEPDEYFLTGPPEAFPPGWSFWEDGALAHAHGVSTRRAYLDLVYKVGSSANGVFGAKLMWNNVPWVVEKFLEMEAFAGMTRVEVFTAVFPNLHVVHLTRHDRVRQAVSWARAAQDGVWIVSDTEPAQPTAEPVYDGEFIGGLLGLIEQGELGWRELFADLGVVAHEIAYEDLVDEARYEPTIRGTLAHLGLDAEVSIRPPRTIRQADELNDAWVERFAQEGSTRASPRKEEPREPRQRSCDRVVEPGARRDAEDA